MTTYIGTATSRVDGRAKVTGAAKYAGEFNRPGLAHASVVTSTVAKGRITRIDGTLVDISERVAMQTEINRQRQSLIHLSRVGTIGKLSGALAHELSQPLTAIMNNAYAIDRMLRQKPVNISEVRDAISDIIEDDSRVNAVISHLRALLKKDNADFGPVDMTLLIHKVLGLVRKELALHRVKPVIAIAPDFPAVWGDEVQLQQLLLNLIMNAVDAIGANGKGSGSLSITAHADGASGTYHLCVSDTGGGFKPAVMEKLFEPFFSTKEQGLGLGIDQRGRGVEDQLGATGAPARRHSLPRIRHRIDARIGRRRSSRRPAARQTR